MTPESDVGGLSIGELAVRSGVADGTLRAWERRYGLLRPRRTDGGHRRYGHADLARVLQMVRLQREGLPAGVAAARILDGGGDEPEAPGTSARSLDTHRRRLAAAADRLDAPAVLEVLRQAQDATTGAAVVDGVLAPVLRDLGNGWRKNPRNIAREHLTSTAIRSWLVSRLWRVTDAVAAPAVVACPDGELHDIGAMMAALTLAEAGWRPVVLGASTPWVSTATVVSELRPPLVLIGTTSRPAALHLLERWTPPPDTTVVFGGSGVTEQDLAGQDRALLHTGRFVDLPPRVGAALPAG